MSAYVVKVSAEVVAFSETLGLEDARTFKRAIKALAEERGDIRVLGQELEGYYRLRVGGYRVIFCYRPGRRIECVFAERRSVVYEVLHRELLDKIASRIQK